MWMSYCTHMASPQEEIEALKLQVASLTARIYSLEQRSGVVREPPQAAIQVDPPHTSPPSGTMLQPPVAATDSHPQSADTPPLPHSPQTSPRPTWLNNAAA